MRILVAAAEALPFFKTGGLADVARALPDALATRGHDVRVIMPGYDFIGDAVSSARAAAELSIPWPGGPRRASIALHAAAEGAPTAFVLAAHSFDVARPYEGEAQTLAARFAFFSRAVVAYAKHWQADVVHLNDWQTGLAPIYALLDDLPAPTVFAIHNVAYQGNFPPLVLPDIDIPASFFRTENGLEFHGHASFMKAGLALADRLVTVSPTHAAEIQTPEYGTGFDGLLKFRRRVLHGILNGIDTDTWNPARDPLLPQRYTARTLAGKYAARTLLAERAGVSAEGPILGKVARLAQQKGVALLLGALPALLERGCSVVILGSGERQFEQALTRAARRWPNRVAFARGFDEPLAHLIYAGADFFLMPSLYEPCGLGQQIAQRYGTPPIARRTGGLNDSIQDGVTGFLFDEPSRAGLLGAVDRALALWHHRGWHAMRTRCMKEDHSWTRSAAAYERLYHFAIGSSAC